MKIAILSRYQGLASRGVESFVSELARKLEKYFEIDIYSGKESDDISQILKRNYGIVYPVNGRMQALKASLGRYIGRYKLIITGHSGRGRDDLWNLVVCRPDAFIALTEQSLDWAKQFSFGVKVSRISNGIDLEKFSASGKQWDVNLPKPVILSVGALEWYKHHELAIQAIAHLKTGSLWIVGDGKLKESLYKLGENLLPGRFAISCFDYSKMPQVYRAANLFTLASWDREAFGIVYLEAMASGLGVVTRKDSSRVEIIGSAGILTDVENPEKYSQAIRQALKIDYKKISRDQATKFSWERIADEYRQLFNAL